MTKQMMKMLPFVIIIHFLVIVVIGLILFSPNQTEYALILPLTRNKIDQSSLADYSFQYVIINGSSDDDKAFNRQIFNATKNIPSYRGDLIEYANDTFFIRSQFYRTHPTHFIANNQNLDPQVIASEVFSSNKNSFLFFIGHSPEPQQFVLDGLIPWPGKNKATISELSNALSARPNPAKRIFYFAPTCFSERMHRLAFDNKNTCGLSNSRWNRVSVFSSSNSYFFGLENFTDLLNRGSFDFDPSPSASLFSTYVITSRYDFINFPAIHLSSSSFIKNHTLQPMGHQQKYESWNRNFLISDWNILYSDLKSLNINRNSICYDDSAHQPRTPSVRSIFSMTELQQLPENLRKNFENLKSFYCHPDRIDELNLNNLMVGEAIVAARRSLLNLHTSCKDAKAFVQNLKDPMYLQWSTYFKESRRSLGPYILPNQQNCFDYVKIQSIEEEKIESETNKLKLGLSPLPIFLEIKRIGVFLATSRDVALKKKLVEIINCENTPF